MSSQKSGAPAVRISGAPAVKRWVFWPAAVLVLAFVAFTLAAPATAEGVFAAVQTAIVRDFSWYYVLIAAGFVGFAIWMGFSRYGDIVLGRDTDKPEFSTASWFSLLFAAGMGIGLVFYGVSEPLSHFADPRPGVTGAPAHLAQEAITQTFLHWGLHAWGIYVVVGLALAYAVHRRGRPVSIRWALEPVLGKRVRGGWGNLIDVIALVGTLFGVATSLGLGVLQISAGLEKTGFVQSSLTVQIVLIIVVTLVAVVSLVTGVARGMKLLSNFNLLLAGALLVFVLIVGPTQFLMREFVQSIGAYLQGFVGLSFTVSAFSGARGEAWQGTWTTFYWGWWMSWAPFVGIFIARISKGRTVRQFVFGVLLVPTLLTFLWFGVLGGTALFAQLYGGGGLIGGALGGSGAGSGGAGAVFGGSGAGSGGAVDVEGALFQLLGSLPAGSVLVVGAIILIAVFFVTSADSGALVMAMIATGGDIEPKAWIRVFFAGITALVAIALLVAAGLTALKTAAITTALPFSIVMILMCWATVVAFSRESRAYARAHRAVLLSELSAHYDREVVAPLEREPRTGPIARVRRRLGGGGSAWPGGPAGSGGAGASGAGSSGSGVPPE
ncbi:choline/glycine/proline betaine transport protein [Frondihabitans sp. PhB188]|uniref:BCCT family transporter n=1 Tax=Frondihabitans sp. PhB188 TaxID=2485200 RepID=UPI000F4745E8|nr:BCCT family transporter [Frondihabitans sp. PhB188]ROQ40669.1 choline/glycine/proline betaine transport protein [Frondihabitans sp. PhB188]